MFLQSSFCFTLSEIWGNWKKSEANALEEEKGKNRGKQLHLKMCFVESWTKGEILYDWKQDEKRKLNNTKGGENEKIGENGTQLMYIYKIEEKLKN